MKFSFSKLLIIIALSGLLVPSILFWRSHVQKNTQVSVAGVTERSTAAAAIQVRPGVATKSVNNLRGKLQPVEPAPTPTEVYDECFGMWKRDELNALKDYSTRLFNDRPTYVPAIVLKCFTDTFFFGEVYKERDSLVKLNVRLKREGSCSEGVLGAIEFKIALDNHVIDMYERHSVSMDEVRKQISPEDDRKKAGDLPPLLSLIKECPTITLEPDWNMDDAQPRR